jgi:hypothetical protein
MRKYLTKVEKRGFGPKFLSNGLSVPRKDLCDLERTLWVSYLKTRIAHFDFEVGQSVMTLPLLAEGPPFFLNFILYCVNPDFIAGLPLQVKQRGIGGSE